IFFTILVIQAMALGIVAVRLRETAHAMIAEVTGRLLWCLSVVVWFAWTIPNAEFQFIDAWNRRYYAGDIFDPTELLFLVCAQPVATDELYDWWFKLIAFLGVVFLSELVLFWRLHRRGYTVAARTTSAIVTTLFCLPVPLPLTLVVGPLIGVWRSIP